MNKNKLQQVADLLASQCGGGVAIFALSPDGVASTASSGMTSDLISRHVDLTMAVSSIEKIGRGHAL